MGHGSHADGIKNGHSQSQYPALLKVEHQISVKDEVTGKVRKKQNSADDK